MATLTITSKGQVTFKQDLLQHLGVKAGQKVEVEKTPHGGLAVKALPKQRNIADFIGCLSPHRTDTLSVEEMNDITAQAWAQTH